MSVSDEIVAQYQRYVMRTYQPSLVLVRGRGCRVWDAEGKEYLDFLGGIAVASLGHAHPKVVRAIRAQAATLGHTSNLFYHPLHGRLAEKLAHLGYGGRAKCFFCNSGAEANEAMVKLARLWGRDRGRYEVVSMTNSFHGRTLAMIAATGQTKYQNGFEPMPPGFVHAEFNNLESVRAALNERTVAVLVEAVQGEGGIVPAAPEFLQRLRALCDERNLLLLCDEVQCGLGRTGRWFAFQAYGIEPDAFTLAKGLANGVPIGALVAGPRLADVFQPGQHASTFGGNPVACAAALATLEVIEANGLVEHAAKMGDLFMKLLRKAAAKHPFVKEVRGRGLMIGLVCDRPVKPLEQIVRERGLLATATHEVVLRFLPPLNVRPSEVRAAARIVAEGLERWSAEQTPLLT